MISPFSPSLIQKITRGACYLCLLVACSTAMAADQPSAVQTEEQKTLYAIGLSVARSLSVFNLTPAELEQVQQGIADSLTGKKIEVDLQSQTAKIQDLVRTRRKVLGEKQAAAGREFLEKAAKEMGAVKTASGMVFVSLAEGKGESPTATDTVKVNYRGTLIDGKEFDSSYKRNKPLEFKLNNVIPCWTEGLQKMKPGGKARLVCPSNLAYGENGAGELILPGATLNFDVELIDVNPPAAAKPAATTPAKPAEPAKK